MCIPVHTIEQLMASLTIFVQVMAEKKYSLLIVDSATLLYDNEYQLEYQRRTHYASFVQILLQFGKKVGNIWYCLYFSEIVIFQVVRCSC